MPILELLVHSSRRQLRRHRRSPTQPVDEIFHFRFEWTSRQQEVSDTGRVPSLLGRGPAERSRAAGRVRPTRHRGSSDAARRGGAGRAPRVARAPRAAAAGAPRTARPTLPGPARRSARRPVRTTRSSANPPRRARRPRPRRRGSPAPSNSTTQSAGGRCTCQPRSCSSPHGTLIDEAAVRDEHAPQLGQRTRSTLLVRLRSRGRRARCRGRCARASRCTARSRTSRRRTAARECRRRRARRPGTSASARSTPVSSSAPSATRPTRYAGSANA